MSRATPSTLNPGRTDAIPAAIRAIHRAAVPRQCAGEVLRSARALAGALALLSWIGNPLPARAQEPAFSARAESPRGWIAQAEPGEIPPRDRPAPAAQLPVPVDISPPPPVPSQIEEVVVTGSRVLRDPNLGSIAPVDVVSADTFEFSGEPDIADVLDDVPALLTSSTPNDSGGGSVLQLRALGADRTLTLVDGRRHVGGVAGTQAVDIGSIPAALIERVEVLTGGASSIYGADAVTGVVNFILKDDFEGFDFSIRGNSSTLGDAEAFEASAVYGLNFLSGRGNLTLASNISRRENLRISDRRFLRNNRAARDELNPAVRFQAGDIGDATPNFARFFDPARGQFPRGTRIPSEERFASDFTEAFGSAPELTDTERRLIRRARRAPPRAILRRPAFAISSISGLIAPADFMSRGTDTDGNGVDDCQESFVGFNSAQGLGGCFVVGRDGRVRPFRDGIISGPVQQFGGDGSPGSLGESFLTPEDDRYALNLTSRFDLTETVSLFGEAKVAFSRSDTGGPQNGFADLLAIGPDNPFIPQELRALAQDAGGLLVSRDFTDLGRNVNTTERRTTRFVGGFEGQLRNGWTWELSANYGRFEAESFDRNRLIQDRLFAALDVVEGPDGQPVCRSELMPDALPPGSASGVPLFDPGFFTFRPGEGKCVPANILGGRNSISPRAVNFITQTVKNESTLEQYVLSGVLSGDTSQFFSLPGGEIGFSIGAEFRDEKSRSKFDPLVRGVLPTNTPAGQKGQLVSDLGVQQSSLVFDPASSVKNTGGSFDVMEAFAEVSLPLLRFAPFAEELTINLAGRYSDYSTIGVTRTYSSGFSYAPISDIRFRGTMAVAVRAPNIGELFTPEQGAFFFPNDPCEQVTIDALKQSGDPRGAQREANCRAAGIPEGFTNPLTARFSGVVSGNRNLKEETADTLTAGFVLQPRFLEGMSLSFDYFDIEIEDAIASVSSQDIVDGCFDSAAFPNNQNCALFTRDPMTLGFNFLRQTQLNFASLETRGVDASLTWDFSWNENLFRLGISGTRVQALDAFFDPADPSAVNPGLGEIARPRYAGNFRFAFNRGPLSVSWQTQYLGKQAEGGVQIETESELFGGEGLVDETYIHDVSFSYLLGERYRISGGVNNVFNERPFKTSGSFPTSPIGRFAFVGLGVSF